MAAKCRGCGSDLGFYPATAHDGYCSNACIVEDDMTRKKSKRDIYEVLLRLLGEPKNKDVVFDEDNDTYFEPLTQEEIDKISDEDEMVKNFRAYNDACREEYRCDDCGGETYNGPCGCGGE